MLPAEFAQLELAVLALQHGLEVRPPRRLDRADRVRGRLPQQQRGIKVKTCNICVIFITVSL